MRVVNLAKKPFVNRRPVVRMATLLWVIGAALLGTNLFLYSSHWQGTADNRELLSEAEQSLREEENRLEEQDQQLTSLDLRSRNRESAFLNGLISQRTFPWSALFDHLERVTPGDVRLVTVQPLVHLAKDDKSSGRRRQTRRRRSSTNSVWDASKAGAEVDKGLDEVELRLSGWSKTEEALTEFIDTLYADPSFRRILLRNEAQENEGGRKSVRFNLEVLFLTGLAKELPEALVADVADPEDSVVDVVVAEEDLGTDDSEDQVAAAEPIGDEENDVENTVVAVPPVVAQATEQRNPPAVLEEVLAARREAARQEREEEPELEEPEDEDDEEEEEKVEEDAASQSRRQRLEALRARSRARAAARDRRQNQAEEAGRRSAVQAGLQAGPGALVGGSNRPEDQPRQGGNQGGNGDLPNRPASSTPGVSWLMPDWMPRLEEFGLQLGILGNVEAEG